MAAKYSCNRPKASIRRAGAERHRRLVQLCPSSTVQRPATKSDRSSGLSIRKRLASLRLRAPRQIRSAPVSSPPALLGRAACAGGETRRPPIGGRVDHYKHPDDLPHGCVPGMLHVENIEDQQRREYVRSASDQLVVSCGIEPIAIASEDNIMG